MKGYKGSFFVFLSICSKGHVLGLRVNFVSLDALGLKITAKFLRNIYNLQQPASSHLLANKAFVSMFKMSNPVLLTIDHVEHTQEGYFFWSLSLCSESFSGSQSVCSKGHFMCLSIHSNWSFLGP